MKAKKVVWCGLMIMMMIACGTPKLVTTGKTEANSFESVGNYKLALEAWKKYFDATDVEIVEGADFAQAAKTAFNAGNLTFAKSWFDQARFKDFADPAMYQTLAEIYESEDNLSKELSALEFYTENYGTGNAVVNTRLLAIYTEIDSNEQALEVWSNMDDASKSEVANLENYFLVNKNLGKSAVCDSLVMMLLEKNPEHLDALEWNAKKYYWAGQKRYEREMVKYNSKKTRKNYAILLKELDLVTADFKKALPYLDKLWKLKPGKEFAGYLANIYARFGDEKKTSYYKNYMK